MDSSFDTRKFWLSSVAIFAGVLVTGLVDAYIDSEGHAGATHQQQVQQSERATNDPLCARDMSDEKQLARCAHQALQPYQPRAGEPQASRAPEGAP